MIKTVIDSHFLLDGGAMNGIVPRIIWSKQHPPDKRGRIQMVSRVILYKDTKQGRLWLIDAGLGDGWDAKQIDIYGIRKVNGGLVRQLVDLGIHPENVTDIVLTHLHFDHCAGVITHAGGSIGLSFPKAKIYIQRKQLQWALSPSLKDAGSYRQEDIRYLASSENLVTIEGTKNLSESICVSPLFGHTEAMQTVTIQRSEKTYISAADLIPMFSHIRLNWIMAYDNQPILTLEEKERFLNSAVQKESIVISAHDHHTPVARIMKTAENQFQYEKIENLDFE